MHSSIYIAQKLLNLAEKNGNTLTPMQLLKLVYIAHGNMLGKYSKPLIKEAVRAWKYGPVIKELYDEIKDYRSNPVQKITSGNSHKKFTKEEDQVIKDVYQQYGKTDGISLSMLTHKKGTPWDLSYNNGFELISNDLIEYHYNNNMMEPV